jgi:hypothetical protein
MIDAELAFEFAGELSQFEVYFTSYFDPRYVRRVRTNGEWVQPEISPTEQLLIPRDDRVAGRIADGRWAFLKDRVRLSEGRFDLPVLVSRDEESGWTFVQMVEPGLCTHLAPNRFANGHNLIVGGWDVKPGEKRTVRIRMLIGRGITDADAEKAYERFADACRKARATESSAG